MAKKYGSFRPKRRKGYFKKSSKRLKKLLNRKISRSRTMSLSVLRKYKKVKTPVTLAKALVNPAKELYFKLITTTATNRFTARAGTGAEYGRSALMLYPDPRSNQGFEYVEAYANYVTMYDRYGITNLWNYYTYFSPTAMKVGIRITNHSEATVQVIYFCEKASKAKWNGVDPNFFYNKPQAKSFLLSPRSIGFPMCSKYIKATYRVKDFITDSPFEEKYRCDSAGKAEGMTDKVDTMRFNLHMITVPLQGDAHARSAHVVDLSWKAQIYGKFTDYKATLF